MGSPSQNFSMICRASLDYTGSKKSIKALIRQFYAISHNPFCKIMVKFYNIVKNKQWGEPRENVSLVNPSFSPFNSIPAHTNDKSYELCLLLPQSPLNRERARERQWHMPEISSPKSVPYYLSILPSWSSKTLTLDSSVNLQFLFETSHLEGGFQFPSLLPR